MSGNPPSSSNTTSSTGEAPVSSSNTVERTDRTDSHGTKATGRARPPQDAGRPVPVTPALASLGRRCAGLFGLRLLGVDLVDGPGGPLVLEVNDFPNYRGADGSPRAVAELTTALATRTAGAA